MSQERLSLSQYFPSKEISSGKNLIVISEILKNSPPLKKKEFSVQIRMCKIKDMLA